MNEVWLRYVESLTPLDYRETIRRMQFQAMGYIKLRESEIYPLTMEELKAELTKSDFETKIELFGETQTLSASDEKNFTIPYHEAWLGDPVFEVVDSKGKTPKAPKKGKSKPKPNGIQTTGLTPINFSMQWKKDRKQPGGYRPVFSFRVTR